MQNKPKARYKKKVTAPLNLSSAKVRDTPLLPLPEKPLFKPLPPEFKTVPPKRSELIRFIQNENGQHYILNGKSIKSAYEAKYSSKSSTGDFRFIMPMEVGLHFPEMKRFNLESLEWDSIEPISLPSYQSQKRNTEIDSSLLDHPYIHSFGKIKVLAKKDSGDLKTSVLNYINNCHNEIKEYIKESLELVSNELEDHSIFALIDFGTSLESMLHQKTFDRVHETRRPFSGSEVYEDWMQEIDKYVVEVYNEGICEEINPSWLRFRVDCLGKVGIETLACLMIRRLISFCKVYFFVVVIVARIKTKHIENM